MPYPRHLAEFDKEHNARAFYNTQGAKKLFRYFLSLLETEGVQKLIDELRKEYKIPVGGFPRPEKGEWTHPPREWKYSKNRKRLGEIRQKLHALSLEYSLLPADWASLFESHLFYNHIFFSTPTNASNLCFIADAITDARVAGQNITSEDRQAYPLVIHISPHASERDILDFIKQTYIPGMKRVQDLYQKDVNIGGVRKRSKTVRERDNLLLKNRTSSNKKLVEKVKEQFPTAPLKKSSVGTTLKRAAKRRKEV